MRGRRELNEQSPAYRALVQATELIFEQIRAGGDWATRVVAAKAPTQTRIGVASFDGPSRKATLKEKLRGREPLPPCASVEVQDDERLMVYAFGLPDDEVPFAQEVTVTAETISEASHDLVGLVARALESIDPAETDSIKPVKMPGQVAEAFPWMLASDEDKRSDPWNA